MAQNQIRHSVRNPTGRLCARCTEMVGRLWPVLCDNIGRTRGYWCVPVQTRAISEFHAGECQLCARIIHYLRAKTRTQPPDQVTALEVSVTVPINGNTSLSFRGLPAGVGEPFQLALSSQDGFIARQFGVASLSEHLDSPEVWQLARHWITGCITKHRQCKPTHIFPENFYSRRMMSLEHCAIARYVPNWYPTRLVDLGPREDSAVRPRLVYAEEEVFCMPAAEPYMTLSHCWGTGFEKVELHTVNEPAWRQSIPHASLPKTIRDAMMATKTLGCRYLWVDSLCIVQDSADDWRHESAMMGDVYSNSICNLCALDAESDAGGFLRPRDPRALEPFVVEGLTPNGRCVPFVVDDDDIWTRVHPLSTRAWVLQEELLAPRCLRFGKDGISWQCREMRALEKKPHGIDPGYFREELRMRCLLRGRSMFDDDTFGRSGSRAADATGENDGSLDEAARAWEHIVEQYTARRLTVLSDRLVAVSGLARALRPRLGPYHAGHWGSSIHLRSDLLWRMERGKLPAVRPAVWRAPSWSWASVEGQVRFTQGHNKPLALVDRSYLSQIHHMEVTTDTGDEFGTPTSGALYMTGLLGKATWDRHPDEKYECRLFLEGMDGVAGKLDFDEDFDAGRQLPPPQVWVLTVLQGIYAPFEIVINSNPGSPREDSPPRELVLRQNQEADEGEGPRGEDAQEPASTVAHPLAHATRLEQDEDDTQGEDDDEGKTKDDGEDDDQEPARFVAIGLVLTLDNRPDGSYRRVGLFEAIGDEAQQNIQSWDTEIVTIV